MNWMFITFGENCDPVKNLVFFLLGGGSVVPTEVLMFCCCLLLLFGDIRAGGALPTMCCLFFVWLKNSTIPESPKRNQQMKQSKGWMILLMATRNPAFTSWYGVNIPLFSRVFIHLRWWLQDFWTIKGKWKRKKQLKCRERCVMQKRTRSNDKPMKKRMRWNNEYGWCDEIMNEVNRKWMRWICTVAQ